MAAPRSVESGSATSNSSHHDGRTRNARAQARHREKRKAYISQLEQTVQRLQATLALSPEQAAELPSPQARLRELEQENEHLRLEIAELRRQVIGSSADVRPGTGNGSRLSPRSNSSGEYNDAYDGRIAAGMGIKRKRSSHDEPGAMVRTPLDTPSSRSASLSRPASQPVPYMPLQSTTSDYPLSSTPRALPSPFSTYPGRDAYFEPQQRLPSLSYTAQSVPRSAQTSMHSDPAALSQQPSTSFHSVSSAPYSHTVPSSSQLPYTKREDDDAYSGMTQTPTVYSHTTPGSSVSSSAQYYSSTAPNTSTSPTWSNFPPRSSDSHTSNL